MVPRVQSAAMILAAALMPLVVRAAVSSNGGLSEVGANPIRRVVTLLEKMAKKVQAEGEEEEALYKKFSCYCKSNGGDLAKSIAASTATVPQVQSDIEAAESEVKSLKQDLQSHQEDREAAKAAKASALALREKENKEFVSTSDEYKSYISALAGAIPAIEKGMAGGFLQNGVGAQLRQAVVQASSLTEYDRQLVTAFLAGGSSEGYVPKSGEIVGILKEIKEDFEKSLADVEATEAQAVQLYEELAKAKDKQVAALTASIEEKTVRLGDLEVSVVNMKNDLTQTEAALVEDQKFAADLEKNCESKATEYEERKKLRAEELMAIHETIKVLNDDEALDLFKKTLSNPSLLQLQDRVGEVQQRVLGLIQGARQSVQSGRPELDFLALAISGKQVDFTKVIKMIDDMVAILAQEQADDDHKKEYCERQIDLAEDKAKALSKTVEDLGTSIAEKEEAIAALASEIKALTEGIERLDKSVAEATEQRQKEHEEFVELIKSNSAAKELLAYAKNRLNKFYNPSLHQTTPAPELSAEDKIFTKFGGTVPPTPAPGGIAGTGVSAPEEPAMFVQVTAHVQHTSSLRRDAPEPPPATWDAYSKKTAETTGVISLIDLLVKDLDKEMTAAETSEKNAQKEYETMTADAAGKRAADTKAIASRESAKADAEVSKASASESEKVTTKELMATKEYEMQLHQECDWLTQNFELRKEARAGEVDALKNAKAVLAGADFSLAQKATSE
eukprot:CAMPEP_0170593734 /NCGR_PEP_ID=MMETSP0224-20130122/13617_1 /TAXON_ID=285029 /ORGANISM="Togula jolla, Strain CCCM 725" /LENGTH=733 /DNA_ID=CAMNT_0010917729 /DNA_START=37 /DNA_END=2235 /DNA_ORIENTATION=-